MTREQVEAAVGAYLRGEFGKLLVVREIRRVRHVSTLGWRVRIVAPLRDDDIEIAELEVDENGVLSPLLDPEGVIDLLRASDDEEPPPSVRADALDLGGFDMEEEAPPSRMANSEMRVMGEIRQLLHRGDADSLDRARSLYPRLLTDPDTRGNALLGMANLERRLQNTQLAMEYLEAASREFADRFDLEALEDAASIGVDIVGKDAFLKSEVHGLLEQSRTRLRPLTTVLEAPALLGVARSEHQWLEMNAELRTVRRGEILVREGEPSRSVFVIRSGVLAVVLEKPDGGQRMIRCCFPGWLLGESSVLTPGARCSATLRAERHTEVFQIDASLLATVMEKNPSLRDRIAQAKQIHRIDSFFAMHETMGQLDALVRDEMLACLQKIETFEEDTLLVPAGDVPSAACLVARGELAMHEGWELDSKPLMVIGADRFVNVRDAIHEIPAPHSTLARAGATVAFFDAAKLRALAEASPPHVAAVLERLG